MEAAITVGANKEAVRESRVAIIAIMSQKCDEETKRVALGVLKGLCGVENTTISHCNFTVK
jgi:hypothetical protein